MTRATALFRAAKLRPSRRAPRLRFEALESRLAPAVTVSPNNLAGWQLTASDGNTAPPPPSAQFGFGPAAPAAGTGSLGFGISPAGSDAAQARNPSYAGTLVSDLEGLSYSTYVSQNNGGNPGNGGQAPYIILQVDQDNNSTVDDLLFFEPLYQGPTFFPGNPQGPLALTTWQSWDALAGGWYSVFGTGGSGPGTNVKPFSTFFDGNNDTIPDRVVNSASGLGGVRFVSGFGGPADWGNFVGNIDNVTIDTAATAPTTFDFEPPATVYVDDTFANPTPGQDPDGGGPATNFGQDSFATITAALNSVTPGGTVVINDGTYPEAVSVTKDVTLVSLGTVTVNSLTTAAANTVGLSGRFDSGGTFALNGPVALTGNTTLNVNALTAAGVDLGGNNLTANVAAASSVAGSITGAGGSLTKGGAGTLILAGTASHGGQTTVNGGILRVNGTLATSPVTVNNSGALDGTGTVGGTVQVNAGGTLAPGAAGAGTLATGSVTFAPGSTFAVDVNPPYTTPGIHFDRLGVTGTVNLGNATLTLLGGAGAPAPGLVLAVLANDGTDPIVGTFNGLPDGATVTVGGFTGRITYSGGDGNDVALVVDGTPAPITGDGTGENFEVRRIGNTIQVLRNGVLIDARPVGGTPSYQINSAGGDDTLFVNHGASGGTVPANVGFDGGTQTDRVTVGGYAVPRVTVTHVGPLSGNVEVGAGGPRVTFVNSEPLAVTGTAADLVVVLPNAANPTVVLADDGAANFPADPDGATAGRSALDGPTFEYTEFAHPTANLMVALGTGDALTINALDAAFDANVSVIGGAGADTVRVAATTGATNSYGVDGGGGADTLQVPVAPTRPLALTGGAATDTLEGPTAATTYNVTGANAGDFAGLATFAGVENLTAGAGADTIQFASGGSLAGTVNGGAGTDTLVGDNFGRTYTVSGPGSGGISGGLVGAFGGIENLTSGTTGDIFLFAAGGTLAGNIDGAGGTNTLVGDNTGRTFTVTGADAGTVSTILGGTFASIANLTGGSGGDTFQFANGGTLSGNISTATGTDTLVGDDGGRTFTVAGTGSGTVGTILGGTFTGVENLAGGGGADTFQFNAGGSLAGAVNGAAGTDTLIGDNTGRTFTVSGANAGAVSTILTAGFSSVENLAGGTGGDNFQFTGGGSLTGTIDGGAGTDTVVGDNAPRTFTVTAANAGTVSVLLTNGFTNVENLTGGTASDTFQFANGGALAGNINAGNGSDVLIADDGGRTFTLTGANQGTLSGLLGGSFSLVNVLVGGAGADTFQFNAGGDLNTPGNIDGAAGSDTIVGDNAARTYTVTGPNAGTVSTILDGSFANVENLTGGSAGDQFTFAGGGSLAGNVDGGGGNNALTGDNGPRTYTINTPNGGTIGTLLGGTFGNVQNLTGGTAADRFQFVTPGSLAGNINGGAGADTLAGDNAARTFTVTGANAGTVSTILGGTFANVENLEGGTAGDTLVVLQPGSLTGSFDGTAGTDGVDLTALLVGQSLTVSALGAVDGFNVTGSPVAGGLRNVNGLTATLAVDTLTGLNADTEWSLAGVNAGTYRDIATTRTMAITGFENLSGGTALDLFVFLNGGSLTGTAAGNAGVDTVDGDDGGRTFAVTGAGSGTVNVILPGGFTGIENLTGGSGADTLSVAAAGTLGGSFDGLAGPDTADLSALQSQQIAASALGQVDGLDTTGGSNVAGGLLNLNTLVGSLTGTTDRLTGLNVASTWTVQAANAGRYGDDGSARSLDFANVENLIGGSATDLLVVQPAGFLGGAFDGRGGYDTGDLSALTAQSPVVSAVGGVDGYELTAVPAVAGGLLNLNQVLGSTAATTDDLTGRNVAATWTVDGANTGTYVDASTRTLDFGNFENLSGGTGNDRLVMQTGGNLNGSFDGGLGIDTGDFALLPSHQFVVQGLGAADGFDVTGVLSVAGNLRNVDAVVGSTAGTTDSLSGLNTASTWTLTNPNAGEYRDDASARRLTFGQVENLKGGTAADLLGVASGSLSGSFDGGLGFDTVTLTGMTTIQAVTVLALGAADGFNTTGGTAVAGGFFNLDKLVGGLRFGAVLGTGDRLIGRDADALWVIKAGLDQSFYTDTGSGRRLVFDAFEELYGGSQKDGFTVDFSAGNPLATTGLTVNGQAGGDSLDTIGTGARDVFSIGVKMVRVNQKPIRYTNLERLAATGGGGNDWFYAPNVTLPSSVTLLQFFAGDGNDLATVAPTVGAMLQLDGGAGTDRLKLLRGLARFVTPIPPRSAVDGTYFFTNRKPVQFRSFEIRDIGIAQPQP